MCNLASSTNLKKKKKKVHISQHKCMKAVFRFFFNLIYFISIYLTLICPESFKNGVT